MNTENLIINKKRYIAPEIEYVKMDTEISLQLQSHPPYPANEASINQTNNIEKPFFT
ncbi:MAG: hypothetical protein ACOYM7_05810 [Paludibacter sp.]|jgi:hypothetical protein